MGYTCYRPSRTVFAVVLLPKTTNTVPKARPVLHCKRWHLFFQSRLETDFCATRLFAGMSWGFGMNSKGRKPWSSSSSLCLTPSQLLHQTGRGDGPASGPEGTRTTPKLLSVNQNHWGVGLGGVRWLRWKQRFALEFGRIIVLTAAKTTESNFQKPVNST